MKSVNQIFFRPSFRELHLSKNTRGMYEIATGLDLFKIFKKVQDV